MNRLNASEVEFEYWWLLALPLFFALGWLGAWLIGHLLTGNRYTRHDAPLSVRRA